MGTPENVGEVSRDPAATSSCKFTPEGKADWAPAHGALHHPGTNTLWVSLLSSPQSSLPQRFVSAAPPSVHHCLHICGSSEWPPRAQTRMGECVCVCVCARTRGCVRGQGEGEVGDSGFQERKWLASLASHGRRWIFCLPPRFSQSRDSPKQKVCLDGG